MSTRYRDCGKQATVPISSLSPAETCAGQCGVLSGFVGGERVASACPEGLARGGGCQLVLQAETGLVFTADGIAFSEGSGGSERGTF